MAKRGRPPYPEVLTPREWEVLSLLREGLTNPQIAERLGISLDGAKYHVSEILTKLGVASREEAAAWQPPAQRPWWMVMSASLLSAVRRWGWRFWAKVAAVTAAMGVLAGLGVLLWGVAATGIPWGEERREVGPPDLSGLTVDDVYARMVEAITRPGKVYHLTQEIEVDAGPFSYSGTTQTWVDVAHDLARSEGEFVFGGETRRTRLVIAGGARYEDDEGSGRAMRREAATCRGTGAALSIVVDCPGPLEERSENLERGEYEGRAAIVVVGHSVSRGSDETWTMTTRAYLDPDTFLPIADEGSGTLDYGEVYPASLKVRYRHDFVDAVSLPADFFDPASIGYVERDPEAPLRETHPRINVYWLGRDFAGADGLPPLTLMGAYVAPNGGSPYEVALSYGLAEDQFNERAVELQEFSIDSWDRVSFGRSACGRSEELSLEGRRVVIRMGFKGRPAPGGGDSGCPAGPYDEFMAHVYMDDTVVFIQPVDVCRLSGCVDSPYNSAEGIQALAAALTLRPSP